MVLSSLVCSLKVLSEYYANLYFFYCKAVLSLYLVAVVELFLKLTGNLDLRFPVRILLCVSIVVHILKRVY